jgi:hypothetical protein
MSHPRPDPPRLVAIRERLEKATPGPWHAPGLGEVHSDHDGGVFARVTADGGDPVVADLCEDADAEFIAYARGDIEALLTERDVLLSDLRTLEAQYRQWEAASAAAELGPAKIAFRTCADDLAALLARLEGQ